MTPELSEIFSEVERQCYKGVPHMFFSYSLRDIIAEIDQLERDAELGKLIRKVLPLIAAKDRHRVGELEYDIDNVGNEWRVMLESDRVNHFSYHAATPEEVLVKALEGQELNETHSSNH